MDPETIAETVGDATANAVENAIETANEQQQQAEQTAEHIAQAAMESERGQRITAIERGFEECRQELAETRQSLSSLQTQVAEVNGAVAALVMAAPIPSSSIQTPPEEVIMEAPPEPEVIVGDPEDAPPVAEVVPEAPPKRKRARWI